MSLKFWERLVRNNTGVSSKTFVLVIAGISGVITLIVMVVILLVDLFSSYKIDSDLYGIAAVITSIATLIGAAAYGKVSSERYEYGNQYFRQNNRQQEEEEF